jgi:hypothetical protein
MILALTYHRLLPTIAKVHCASYKDIRGKDIVVGGIIKGKKPLIMRKGIAKMSMVCWTIFLPI